ncbi:PepSY domain-containing protein [Clostridium niameyense]|uniref:PepSY domain-containing protein n=1 Tax=Clostridium niameyense TaxID=1622073 RepID=A0A6M0RBM2_9CLOT|nr:PepSY-associated TM helix domain-containing protein [Clostridium niameyense]NEZ46959.1 PepSY domain-containing protein [Clostridium niameyense]
MFSNKSAIKYNKKLHVWFGIIPAIIFLLVSITGILLIYGKSLSLVPKSQKGVKNEVSNSISMKQVEEISFKVNKKEILSAKDIKKIEFYPNRNVYRVRSKKGYDIQIDMSTGKVLSAEKNIGSILLALHTGSFFGEWFEKYIIAGSALSLVIVTITGMYLFIFPILKKKKLIIK